MNIRDQLKTLNGMKVGISLPSYEPDVASILSQNCFVGQFADDLLTVRDWGLAKVRKLSIPEAIRLKVLEIFCIEVGKRGSRYRVWPSMLLKEAYWDSFFDYWQEEYDAHHPLYLPAHVDDRVLQYCVHGYWTYPYFNGFRY